MNGTQIAAGPLGPLGPLEVRDGSAVFSPAGNARPYSVRVADCLGYQAEREAYAQMFAAAPDLLAALKALAKLHVGRITEGVPPELSAAWDAIAKAERKQP